MRYRAGTLQAAIALLLLGAGCASSPEPLPNPPATEADIEQVRGIIEAQVDADAIARFAWDDPTERIETLTRRALAERLVAEWKAVPAPGGACAITAEEVAAALERPNRATHDDLNRWAGVHRDVLRAQARPDDAEWARAEYDPVLDRWEQVVTWQGDAPRVGWNRLDARGLYGWDPKLAGTPHAETGLVDDGQQGRKGTHVGYPFVSAGGCHCIVWITPKEAYLECVDADGVRTAAGLGHHYVWRIER